MEITVQRTYTLICITLVVKARWPLNVDDLRMQSVFWLHKIALYPLVFQPHSFDRDIKRIGEPDVPSSEVSRDLSSNHRTHA